MSAVELCRLWFNDAADPSDRRGFAYVGDSYQVTPTLGGAVDTDYASGRSRAFSTPEDSVHVQATLHNLDADDRAWLNAHRGRTVCFRDPLGLKVFLTYYEIDMTFSTWPDALPGTDHTGGLDATSVTYSEAV